MEKNIVDVMRHLEDLKHTDIRKVNPEELVDISEVVIDEDMSPKERAVDYIRQVKNPYCFKSNGIVVKVSFAGTRKLEECLASCDAL